MSDLAHPDHLPDLIMPSYICDQSVVCGDSE